MTEEGAGQTNAELVEVLLDTLQECLRLELAVVSKSDGAVSLSSCVHVWGRENYILALDASEALAVRAAQALLETSDPVSETDLSDAFAELINVVVGNLVGSDDSAQFTRPVVGLGSPILVPNARAVSEGHFRERGGGTVSYRVFPGTA